MTHAEVDKVPIFKADDIVNNNSPTLVPIMYRIATEHFVQSNMSTFKIIECRNVTKLISDWKPSLPDRLISLGHQVSYSTKIMSACTLYNSSQFKCRKLIFSTKNDRLLWFSWKLDLFRTPILRTPFSDS